MTKRMKDDMTKRMKHVGWLLVLSLGSGCSGGSDADTGSQTGQIAESEAEESAESEADEPTKPSPATDTSDSEAAGPSMGQPAEPSDEASESPADPAPGPDAPASDQDCSAPDAVCPPPPIDWCDSDRDVPIPEWLAEHWNSFCDEEDAAPDAGAASADDPSPAGNEPASAEAIACGIAMDGPDAAPCPPPPSDWCGVDPDDFPLPAELVAYWSSTCGDAGPSL